MDVKLLWIKLTISKLSVIDKLLLSKILLELWSFIDDSLTSVQKSGKLELVGGWKVFLL